MKAKLEPPTDAQLRRERNTQLYLQQGIEADVAQRILKSDGPLEEWELDYLTQICQELRSWQESARREIDNRISRARAAAFSS